MAGAKQPIDLALAKKERGQGKHWTKKELALRQQTEVRTEKVTSVRAPKYLPDTLREDFKSLQRQLLDIKIFAKLDADTLAAYLIARDLYLSFVPRVQACLRDNDTDTADKLVTMQDKYFKQCRRMASELGLSITSRCRLVLPTPNDPADDDPMAQMLARRRERVSGS